MICKVEIWLNYCPKFEMEESSSFSSPTAKIITINIKTNHPLKITALAFKPVTKNEKKSKPAEQSQYITNHNSLSMYLLSEHGWVWLWLQEITSIAIQ